MSDTTAASDPVDAYIATLPESGYFAGIPADLDQLQSLALDLRAMSAALQEVIVPAEEDVRGVNHSLLRHGAELTPEARAKARTLIISALNKQNVLAPFMRGFLSDIESLVNVLDVAGPDDPSCCL